MRVLKDKDGNRYIDWEPLTLSGEAAEAFLAEMQRVENLPPDSEEAKARAAFLEECLQVYERSRPKDG